MKQEIFHNVYAGFMKETRIYIHNKYITSFYDEKSRIQEDKNDLSRVCLLHSKIMKPRGITMVLAHSIERCIVYLIMSKNTINNCVVLTHGIGKG